MTAPATILHSIDTGGPGGAETVFLKLASRLTNYEGFAIAKGGGWVESQLQSLPLPHSCLNPAGTFNWPYLKTIIRLVREHDVDLICSHLFGSNLYCAMAALWCRKPLVSVFHGAHDLAAMSRLGEVKRRIIESGSSRIIAVSDDLRRDLVRAGFRDSNKVAAIYNGVDTRAYTPRDDTSLRDRFGIRPGDILLGAIGNIRPAKAYDVFVDAAAMLASQHDNIHFIIAGQGDNSLHRDLAAQAKSAGLAGRLHFPGFVDNPEVLYNNLDVYVSSSSSEGFSISCVEALASGVPVVATRSGGPEEIISDGVNGLLVPTGDAAAIANAVNRLLEDQNLRSSLIQQGLFRARQDFSEQQMIGAYDELFRELISAT
jgi:glycosyltransferase involved in cell wall biosynthesis